MCVFCVSICFFKCCLTPPPRFWLGVWKPCNQLSKPVFLQVKQCSYTVAKLVTYDVLSTSYQLLGPSSVGRSCGCRLQCRHGGDLGIATGGYGVYLYFSGWGIRSMSFAIGWWGKEWQIFKMSDDLFLFLDVCFFSIVGVSWCRV